MLLCSSRKSTPLGPRTSTPAGSGISQDLSFEAQFSPSIPPTPSPTPRTGRQPASLLNLAREQVRAQGINPMEFMVRPLCEAGRRGGVGPIVVPPFTPPTPQPSSLDFSSPRSTPRRRKRGGRRRRHTPSPAGGGRRAAGGGRRAAGGGRRAEEVVVVVEEMIVVLIPVRTEEVKDGKYYRENFNDCNKII